MVGEMPPVIAAFNLAAMYEPSAEEVAAGNTSPSTVCCDPMVPLEVDAAALV
jgi:hypothetical protein